MKDIESIALAMVQKGKGILAADESNSTMGKRLESVKIPSTESNRLNFRETLFTSQKIKDFISGVILFDETNMDLDLEIDVVLHNLLNFIKHQHIRQHLLATG